MNQLLLYLKIIPFFRPHGTQLCHICQFSSAEECDGVPICIIGREICTLRPSTVLFTQKEAFPYLSFSHLCRIKYENIYQLAFYGMLYFLCIGVTDSTYFSPTYSYSNSSSEIEPSIFIVVEYLHHKCNPCQAILPIITIVFQRFSLYFPIFYQLPLSRK